MTKSIFIDGAVGTTGLEIADRLAGRAEFTLITLDDDKRKDPAAKREALNDADFVILCLPDDAAKEAVAMTTSSHTRIIDASTAYRIDPDWAYGFAEYRIGQRDRIASARLVSNPGCYPTGFLGLVAPLVAAGLIPADWPYTVNAVSGYSGGGKALIQRLEGEGADIGFRTYGLDLAHKHVPEMQVHAGLVHAPIFAPAVVRAFRGMIVEVPLPLFAMPKAGNADALRAALAAHYAGSPVVTVHTEAAPSELLMHADQAPTDRLDLYVLASPDGSQVRLLAMLDNLGKGASGAAVQNLNIMAGLDETSGLRL
ncbi:MAG: N-acetyl-gamma-glutamyl-phosphate reductase [Sphingorhabdus sp.]|uniref:N-acetyl-gamma-glutamyl-phosphate reductase n=1 Tax=Sphingorhabdus sp. TaxID=1902408 RepID=UPI00273E0CF9|nr:N-acetyl-gamma-glutamyl-phosphate reductase [Sphingorhabdus sp.]MDP4757050.1 N-acetyl-gamma-glutamyl-phosphate reductase [Sphingorhabdus sp.]MDP4872236.1 N-acetyl-gamma-glutamyl-phosphate reductase [Sphingorhabdus sp.]MDP4925981.1 N-acetyl-gamma-glutamyl-phosphate reductase [Sphingorhabdus sp.]